MLAIDGEASDLGGDFQARIEPLLRGPQTRYRTESAFSLVETHELGGKVAVRADGQVVSALWNRALKMRFCELERLLGKKTMVVEILKEATEIARGKSLISRMPLPFN